MIAVVAKWTNFVALGITSQLQEPSETFAGDVLFSSPTSSVMLLDETVEVVQQWAWCNDENSLLLKSIAEVQPTHESSVIISSVWYAATRMRHCVLIIPDFLLSWIVNFHLDVTGPDPSLRTSHRQQWIFTLQETLQLPAEKKLVPGRCIVITALKYQQLQFFNFSFDISFMSENNIHKELQIKDLRINDLQTKGCSSKLLLWGVQIFAVL